jgi:L-ascorbate 6-phosphate lactonase
VLQTLPPAALVATTHEHDDHTDPFALRPLSQNLDCLFLGASPSAAIAKAAGFTEGQIRILDAGDSVQHHGFTIHALPALDPDAQKPLAYVVEVVIDDDGGVWRMYHGGDTQMSEYFAQASERYAIDCCCLSAGGVHNGVQYYLTPAQTLEAARLLKAKTLIPVHWDLWTINRLEKTVWDALRDPTQDVKLVIMQPGDGFDPIHTA